MAKNEENIPVLYKTFVQPLLYTNVIWGPIYKGDQKSIEAVQRRATKLILKISHLPYEARLRPKLTITTTQEGKGRYDHSI